MKDSVLNDACQKRMKLVTDGIADLALQTVASLSVVLVNKLETLGILFVGDLLRCDGHILLGLGLDERELSELTVGLGEGLDWVLDSVPSHVRDAYYELWRTLRGGGSSPNCLAGYLGPSCVWTCYGGILTVDVSQGEEFGVLPASFVVEDEDDPFAAGKWLWSDLLGDAVHDVRGIVIGAGVRARSAKHMFGWSDYIDDDTPHSFSNALVVDLSQLDCSCVDSMEDLCFDCATLRLFLPPESARPTNVSRMFEGCSSLKSVDLSWLDAGDVKEAERVFAECRSLAELDLSDVKFSSVARLDGFFDDAGVDWRLRCKGGLDARVAEEIAFARGGSMLAAQLGADLRLADLIIEELARCNPTTPLQATTYLFAAHEVVSQRFVLMHMDSGWNKRWRIWRLIDQLDELLANLANGPSEKEEEVDMDAVLYLRDLVRRGGRVRSFDAAFDYLRELSSAHYALTAWMSKAHHDHLSDTIYYRSFL